MFDFFKSLFDVVKGLAPVVGTVLTVFFPQLGVPKGIIDALPGMIATAEAALGDGSGSVKKDAVLKGAELLAQTMTDNSTGGQKETWQQIQPMVGTLIDGIVAGVNAVKPGTVIDNNQVAPG